MSVESNAAALQGLGFSSNPINGTSQIYEGEFGFFSHNGDNYSGNAAVFSSGPEGTNINNIGGGKFSIEIDGLNHEPMLYTYQIYGSDATGQNLVIAGVSGMPNVGGIYILANTPLPTDTVVHFSSDNPYTPPTQLCFVEGTEIATPEGAVRVEHLEIGQRVITAAGEIVPIIWIGQRTIGSSTFPPPQRIAPFRIRKDAFGDGRPYKDLLLSPGHAVAVECDGAALVPVERLANGASVIQEQPGSVTYWHVELPSHGLMVANGLAAESFYNTSERDFLTRTVREDAATSKDTPDHARSGYCLPLIDSGPRLELARRLSLQRAISLGWKKTRRRITPVITVDGISLQPEQTIGGYHYRVPSRGSFLKITSPTFRPQDWDATNGDERSLGVMVTAARILEADGTRRAINCTRAWVLAIRDTRWRGVSLEKR